LALSSGALPAHDRSVEGGAELIYGDRRSLRRYESQLPMRFEEEGQRGLPRGSGITADFSRKSLRFQTEDPPAMNASVEIRVEWPFLLQGVCGLELVVRGPVISASKRGIVVRIASYEFQTCGERSFTEAPPAARSVAVA
jgi:hypothetical protein